MTKEPTYKINPNFRLTTQYLSVQWHCVDAATLECEAALEIPDRFVYRIRKSIQLLAQYHAGIIDIIYCPATDFTPHPIQNWLRKLLRDIILRVANDVLPKRVAYWEHQKGIYGTGVTVKRLRKNILGKCSHSNHITLQPFLVIFKQEWMDGVILHEMAHYKYKHHRKPFWDYLTLLLGRESGLANIKDQIAISPYYNYYLYLTR